MDASTEHLVFDRLLGSNGLLRANKATVIIATHAGQFVLSTEWCRDFIADLQSYLVNLLPSADYVIALGNNGDIVEQGTFEELNKTDGYVSSLSVQETQHQSQSTEPEGKFSLGQIPASSALQSGMDEKKRQLGDLTVYRYYFRAVGTMTTFLFAFFAAAHGFFYSFPSKSTQ